MRIRRQTACDVIQMLGGMLLVAALFYPWTGDGPGSAIPAYRVGQLLASGVLDAVVPRWAAVLLYAGPAGGALATMAVGLDGPARRVCTVTALALILVTAVPALALLRATPLGAGLALTLTGSTAVVGSVATRWRYG